MNAFLNGRSDPTVRLYVVYALHIYTIFSYHTVQYFRKGNEKRSP